MRYLVAYNLASIPEEIFIQSIYNLDESAHSLFGNLWMLDTEFDSIALRDELAKSLGATDKLVVCRADGLAIKGFGIKEGSWIVGLHSDD